MYQPKKIEPIAWPSKRVLSTTRWTPPAGTRIISADDHALEPAHLWEERLPAKYRDKAPRTWWDENGRYHMVVGDRSLDVPGLDSLVSEGLKGFADREQRLKDMDAEGIEASLVFHGRTMGLNALEDKELYAACIDVYNEYLAEWCKAAPNRLIGIAILPTIYKPETTRDYVQKIKALGFKAMQIPSAPKNVPYNASAMEPMWDAIEESGIPLNFHIGAYLEHRGKGSTGANLTKNLAPYRSLWALLAFSGILERHPEMKIVFAEGGASWVASTIQDADKIYRQYSTELNPKLAQLPSYYWHRQCYTAFMDDPVGMKLVDEIGPDTLLWSMDYPHAEGVNAQSNEVLKSIHDTVGEEKFKKIVGGNAAKLWGI